MQTLFTSVNPPVFFKWGATLSRLTLFFILTLNFSCVPEPDEAPGKDSLMGNGYGIERVTLVVNDLEATLENYTKVLGFSIRNPSEFEKGDIQGTLLKSAVLGDNSNLFFVGLDDSTAVEDQPAFIKSYLAQNEGVRMYSISTSSVDSTLQWLVSQGFETDSIKALGASENPPESWSSDDGLPEEFEVSFDTLAPPAYLPSFIEGPKTNFFKKFEKTLFGFGRSFFRNPNGVVGIASLQMAVEDFGVALAEFKKMGLEELEVNKNKKWARFKIKGYQELHLMGAQSPEDEVAQIIATQGPGIFAIQFYVQNLNDTYCFLRERLPEEALLDDTTLNRLTVPKSFANGVRLEFEQEPEELSQLAEALAMGPKLPERAKENAKGMYLKYCALCHGENREGYAADFAPSLRSHSLMATAKSSNFLRYTVQYGRAGTAMAGYFADQGGPLEYIEIELLLQWLYEESGVEEPVKLSREPVDGDIALGAKIYDTYCASCHGENGEGISAPALGNPMLLATATDEFLRYAIAEGRDSTPMIAFKDTLSSEEIDAVTSFLRSRAAGWEIPEGGDPITLPKPENYVLNPNGKTPKFELREDRYLSSEQLNQALADSARIMILDARSEVAWRQLHIPGAFPVPYYQEPETFIEDIPNDDTWIVAYCACPHAASGKVINTLKRYGYKNTAILDEGILIWSQLGFPVQSGR